MAWAAREFVDELADVQPLVLVFEDIHWAEEPLLELIDHLAQWVRERALLMVCLARPELLDVRPGWGGGRIRSTAIELEPLAREESEELAAALLAQHEVSEHVTSRLLEKTEGNPLFVEETVRMLVEEGSHGSDRIPDTLQALIGARIDRLPAGEKILLQRGSVMGRTFFAGAVDHLSAEYDADELDDMLDDLLLRDLVTREERSTISGETAYRFKHVLIREVAYGGLSKSSRAEYHTRFAEWLREKADKELLEIRAYHLDQACTLYAELDGSPPVELAKTAAKALQAAGKRALADEALAVVEPDDHEGRFSALDRRARIARWQGGLAEAEEFEQQALEEARAAGRKDQEAKAALQLAGIHIGRMEEAKAAPLIDRALELAEHSGSIVARASASSSKGLLLRVQGDHEGAAGWLTKAVDLYREAASMSDIAWTSRDLAIVAWET